LTKTLGLVLAFALAAFSAPAEATPSSNGMPVFWAHIKATVSLSRQEMTFFAQMADARQLKFTWPISSGRKGFETPTGQYKPLWADAEHRSSIYEDAPMPYAVFFTGGYAIHGTTEVRNLGRPASHGCVRLDPANAQIFYNAVNTVGLINTVITVSD
jgi:hypothetical protein